MGLPVIVLFAAAWVSILLSGEYRARRHCGPPAGDPGLVLRRPASMWDPHSPMRQRQRAALVLGGIVTSALGGLAALVGGQLWAVFGVSAIAFAGYILLVARVRARQAEHSQKVRPILPPAEDDAASQRRVG